MNDKNSTPEDPQTVAANTKTSQTFTAALSAMKVENQSEAERIVATTVTKGKPQTIADACVVMKEQNLDEAQRLVPRQKSDRPTKA
jgi:hypothetical protein